MNIGRESLDWYRVHLNNVPDGKACTAIQSSSTELLYIVDVAYSSSFPPPLPVFHPQITLVDVEARGVLPWGKVAHDNLPKQWLSKVVRHLFMTQGSQGGMVA